MLTMYWTITHFSYSQYAEGGFYTGTYIKYLD